MKAIVYLTLVIYSLLCIQLHAEEKKSVPPPFSYDGKIAGLYCAACSSKVKAALGKLEGVTEVKITKTEEQGIQRIQISSNVDSVTKDNAVKALGEDAKSFSILSLDHAKSE